MFLSHIIGKPIKLSPSGKRISSRNEASIDTMKWTHVFSIFVAWREYKKSLDSLSTEAQEKGVHINLVPSPKARHLKRMFQYER